MAENTPISEILAKLPRLEIKKQQISQELQEIPLETQLLYLADVSLNQEIELLKEKLE